MMELIEQVVLKLDATAAWQPDTLPPTLRIAAGCVPDVLAELHQNPNLYFDQLACLTGVDNGTGAGTMEVVYHLYSIPFLYAVAVKTVVPRHQPQVPSVAHIWQTANWHEREAFDLLGIRFTNHPDLRRILLPADWQGHPLQKDYQPQADYRGMSVNYDREKLHE
jgi:NADH-quinone oxidoreductase subunit C